MTRPPCPVCSVLRDALEPLLDYAVNQQVAHHATVCDCVLCLSIWHARNALARLELPMTSDEIQTIRAEIASAMRVLALETQLSPSEREAAAGRCLEALLDWQAASITR